MMLHSVPTQINKAARSVTLRHPNGIPCHAFRQRVLRQADGGMGGMPILGGLGVLDSSDESDVGWELLGDAKLLIVENFQPSTVVDRGDALDNTEPQIVALIEALRPEENPAHFTAKTKDVLYMLLHADVKIAYEVVAIDGDINIAPYSRKYILHKRDDLTYIDGFRNG
ncbi:hypothetical protein [Collimonas sp. PA-H2]|uniref:hypothetical protein n=1 Tax=Collimonas sp. PA-H2 TaxID=1881062 RepID=UPI000BF80F4D|nr:hypothetical protein [Collimonas sp. PA-H2]